MPIIMAIMILLTMPLLRLSIIHCVLQIGTRWVRNSSCSHRRSAAVAAPVGAAVLAEAVGSAAAPRETVGDEIAAGAFAFAFAAASDGAASVADGAAAVDGAAAAVAVGDEAVHDAFHRAAFDHDACDQDIETGGGGREDVPEPEPEPPPGLHIDPEAQALLERIRSLTKRRMTPKGGQQPWLIPVWPESS